MLSRTSDKKKLGEGRCVKLVPACILKDVVQPSLVPIRKNNKLKAVPV